MGMNASEQAQALQHFHKHNNRYTRKRFHVFGLEKSSRIALSFACIQEAEGEFSGLAATNGTLHFMPGRFAQAYKIQSLLLWH